MQKPTYQALLRIPSEEHPRILYASGSPAPQGNPRFYKYLWQVFSLQSPWEGGEFFAHAPVLCNADVEKEVQRLVDLNLSCLVYGFRRPRRDPANPWDLTSPRWQGVRFAVSWDEDTDPVVMGGHR
ncbi:hypothetical protein [Pseudoduganella albidiflava]|uniref:Uncharacterized protein n=1 Tax=Pseudoduganella albidiflava TaxID=321983 RepID=A0A411WXY0_9BURK|nr:hypothetical protein [Pseudoduganella albidiflava]QBI01559.1 hypothetical protein EYF70_12385 [Pseudoduganella albidiflava]GGY34742.1 hypothetical protein GCM10007387_15890 [Pseudoduganella albidiflava]